MTFIDCQERGNIEPATGCQLVCVGDIMLGRGVGDLLESGGGDDLLSRVAETLTGDVVTGNLECVIADDGERNPNSHSHFKVSAAHAAEVLNDFDIVSLANNHIFDYLDEGIEETIAALRGMGISHVGAGRTQEEALRPVIAETQSGSVAVFGASSAVCYPPTKQRYTVASPGTDLLDAVRTAAGEHAWVVVHLHAGGGDYRYPAPDVRRTHEALREAGATVVAGHHPHVAQGWICDPTSTSFFSLGDFVFDRCDDGRGMALVSRCTLSETLSCCVQPVIRDPDLALRLPSPEEEEGIRSQLLSLSESIASGVSDNACFDAAAGDLGDALLGSVRKDLSSGGVRALFTRAGRVTPAKLGRTMRIAARRLSRRQPEKMGDGESVE